MSKEETGISHEFLLKQIENEINAGFVFVERARKAMKLSRPVEAEGALAKAVETHQHLLNEVTDTPAGQVRAVTHQLAELREAIDWLREMHFRS